MSCDSGTCSTNSGTKANQSTQPCQPAQSCCDTGACQCPVEQSIHMWNGAFCKALAAVQVELLKERIKKAWGPVLEKEADAVVTAMGTVWQSKLASTKAQLDLRETIREVLESVKA